MSPTDLKISLIRAGTTQRAIAASLGVHPSLVNIVIKQKSRNPRIRRAIAAALQLSYRGVWGVEDPGVDHERPGRSVIRQPVDASRMGGAA